ncbi:hypothetical protein SAMN05444161_2096 [Rhizobiales bacterium GAS191]|nr:hypothetical protein SAMN05519103_01209 [Rhizobiales bacterium GAS113]SEC35784.1 hypothetical protein SAMN05519104_1226 [Rhizobiales bacterium GAS188]SEC91468.1 hypothetical protein SAMN05444161_2096 [Rhizobiales bacterium GAS191]
MKDLSARRIAGAAISAVLLSALAGCVSQSSAPSAAAAPSLSASSIPADSLVGRWGLASYHNEADRKRTEVAARGQCHQPYVIGKGQSGGVMMRLADSAKEEEVFVRSDANGKSFIGPSGATAEQSSLEIVSLDKKELVARWIDPEIAARYGTMVYVRC